MNSMHMTVQNHDGFPVNLTALSLFFVGHLQFFFPDQSNGSECDSNEMSGYESLLCSFIFLTNCC